MGLSSETYQSTTGDDLLRWNLAQQIYLAAREVTLDSAGGDTSDFSPLVGDITFNLTQTLRTDGFLNWNWDGNQVDHWRLGATYDRDVRKRLSTSYSWYETSDSLQLDFTWPIASRWQFGATALRSDADGSDLGTIQN